MPLATWTMLSESEPSNGHSFDFAISRSFLRQTGDSFAGGGDRL